MKVLDIVPIFKEEAWEFLKQHRHHKPPQGGIFWIAVANVNTVVGVAVVGRPPARHQQDGLTACVTRLCTDGTRNACSKLYSACWRIAREMGYRRLITYILKSEPGTSLRAAGWRMVGERGGGPWSRSSRPRVDTHPEQKKILFEMR